MNNKSPYTATITGCALLFNEFARILPLLLSDNSTESIKEEVRQNQLLQVNSQKARQTFMNEFRRRFQAVPKTFGRIGRHGVKPGKKPDYCMLFYELTNWLSISISM